MMEAKPGDQRLGQLIEKLSIADVSKEADEELKAVRKIKVAIIGVPCDEGVRRNKGRLGAKDGPAVFRQMLAKTGSLENPEFDVDIRNRVKVYDLGDVTVPDFSASSSSSSPSSPPPADLLASVVHDQVRTVVKWCLERRMIPFVVGGGNDQSYAVASGLLEYVRENRKSLGGVDYVGVVNVDAHLDVRPLIDGGGGGGANLRHSGCPFRLLLEDPLFNGTAEDSSRPRDDVSQFVEFGAQGNQCSLEHAQYVKSRNGRIIWLNELRGGIAPMSLALSRFRSVLDSFGLRSNIFVSFDVDSIRSADCPGVSCPSPIGLTSEEALSLCLESGRRENVAVFDMSEFNPAVESDRTSRLLANMFYYFCLGLAQRI